MRIAIQTAGIVPELPYFDLTLTCGAQGPDGVVTLPMLIDGDQRVCGTQAVVEHLFSHYGRSLTSLPLNYRLACALDRFPPLALLPTLMRPLPCHGLLSRPSVAAPLKPLELWGYESSPFVLRVREALCCLELPYVSVHAAWGSAKRTTFLEAHGGVLSDVRRATGLIQVSVLAHT